MPERSRGEPGTDRGREIFWKSVAKGSSISSSSSNESGYAVTRQYYESRHRVEMLTSS